LIAATVAALLAWFFRGPLIDMVASRRSQASVQPDPANDDFDELTEEPAQ